MNAFLLALGGAIGTAVVGVVAAWITQVIKNRDEEQLRKKAVEQVRDEISVIDAWVKAHVALSSAAQLSDLVQSQARRDLDVAYDKMRKAAAQVPQRRWISLQEVISPLLLRRLNPRGAARIFQLIYYFSLFMIIVWVGTFVGQQKSWTDPGELAASIFALVVLGVVPAWAFAKITVVLAHRSGSSVPKSGRSRDGSPSNSARHSGLTDKTPEQISIESFRFRGRAETEDHPSGGSS